MSAFRLQKKLGQFRISRLGLLGLSLCLLSACTSTPTLPPNAKPVLPDAWKSTPASPLRNKANPDMRPQAWWLALNDPALTLWIEWALVRNRDLVRSALRLQQASLQVQSRELDAWPRVNANMGTSVQRPFGDVGGTTTTVVNGVSIPVETNIGSNTSRSANAGLSVSYEVDLWGRVSQSIAVAKQDQMMAQADLETARWLLTTQVAEQYWNLAVIDAKKPYLEQAMKDAKANLDMVRLKLSQGKVREGEEHKAVAAWNDANQRRSALNIQRANVVQALALLFDEPPQSFHVAHARLPEQFPTEPDSWPLASVLDRQASVRRSRMALDQALLKLDIAQTNRYPQLSLSASLNSSGNALRDVLTNPMGALGLNLTLPVLDWKRLGIEQDTARLALQISVMDFRDALYKALAEVETQYNNRRQWQADAEILAEKTDHAQQALQVAQLRYEQGVDPLQSVRDAQGSLRELQLSALDTRLKAWVNQVAIFKAWGGPLAGPNPKTKL